MMKRALALALLLLASGGLQACAAAIIGGGGNSQSQCQERDPRKCQTKVNS
jgi:predicted small secreted protein